MHFGHNTNIVNNLNDFLKFDFRFAYLDQNLGDCPPDIDLIYFLYFFFQSVDTQCP